MIVWEQTAYPISFEFFGIFGGASKKQWWPWGQWMCDTKLFLIGFGRNIFIIMIWNLHMVKTNFVWFFSIFLFVENNWRKSFFFHFSSQWELFADKVCLKQLHAASLYRYGKNINFFDLFRFVFKDNNLRKSLFHFSSKWELLLTNNTLSALMWLYNIERYLYLCLERYMWLKLKF